MYKNSLRLIFFIIVIVWMFLLSFSIIYSKKLRVKTSSQEIDFQVEEQPTENLPQGIKITKPGVKGTKFTSQEYISIAGKPFDLTSSENIYAAQNEIIYIGNGDDVQLKESLVEDFNSSIETKSDQEVYQNFKNPTVTFLNETSETENPNLIAVGELEFLMDNCKFYNSIQVLIDKSNLALNLGEVAEDTLCEKYETPSSPQPINCGSNCDLAPVDKHNTLSSSYVPNVIPVDFMNPGFEIKDLVYPFLKDMYVAAQNDGINFKLTSTYRSYNTQKGTFDGWVQFEMSLGKSYENAVAAASTYSALPGHSEHQLGTTADMNSGDCAPFVAACDDNERVWKWLADNAHKFGFVMSYQPYKEHLTGYVYEPWHYRWIGVDLATLYKTKYEGISYSTEFLRNINKYDID